MSEQDKHGPLTQKDITNIARKLSGDKRYHLFSAIAQLASKLPIEERQNQEYELRSLTAITAKIIKQAEAALRKKGDLKDFYIDLLCYSDDPGPGRNNIPLVKAVLRHFQNTSESPYNVDITEKDRRKFTEGADQYANIIAKIALPTKLPQLVFIQKTIQFRPDDVYENGITRTEISLIHKSKAPHSTQQGPR